MRRLRAGAATAVIGAPEGARVPQSTSHKDFALFGAPSPSHPGRGTRRGKEPACWSECRDGLHHLPLMGRAGARLARGG